MDERTVIRTSSRIIGVLLLASTFFIALNPSRVALAYIPLVIGFVLFHFGIVRSMN
jgi:hypothetical protein